MEYVAFIGTEGPAAPEELEVMRRELPGYVKEMDRRGVRLFGRELDFPDTAATVRVRDGEVLVTDGPFAETKEFVGGFDLLRCADLDEAIEVAEASPVAWFKPLEVRPFTDGLRLGAKAEAFGNRDDSDGIPYLLSMWMGDDSASTWDDETVRRDCDAWRDDLETRGVFVLGNALGGPDTATTIRFRDGTAELSDGPLLDIDDYVAGIDVIRCADRNQAVEVASTHPIAKSHAIEVRPFYVE